MPDIPANLPPPTDYEFRTLGWMKEALQEGEAFLRSQRGYHKINESIDAIIKDTKPSKPSLLSATTINHVAKVATDLTALCTDVKPFWEYRTQNERYKKQVEITGHLSEHWWLNRFIDLKFADCIRYSIVGASGYTHHFYNDRTMDLDVEAEDPRDIIPIRPPSTSLLLQECFGVIHRACRTVNYVKALFPKKADYIVADGDGSSSPSATAGRAVDLLGMPAADPISGIRPVKDIPRVPVVNLYTCYINDDSTNDSSSLMYMGNFDSDKQPMDNWSYTVKPGDPIYPRKRCIIFTNTVILYDGPNPYWHGMFPYCKLMLDPWPWTWLGKAIVWDLLPIQTSHDRIMRVVDDHLEKVARPDVIGDKNTISKTEMDKIDTRKAGLKIRMNPSMGKGVEITPPVNLPQDIMAIINYYEQKLYELPGVRDLSSLMRLNQLPAPETIERMLEAMAPSVRLRSRIIEAFMRDFATITAWNFAQFKTLPERLAILGDQGATEQDFDFDPDTFIPAWTGNDYADGVIKQSSLARGPLPRYDRAKEFFKQISYHIAPSSLLNASEIETQLKYLQLSRAGLVDHWTLLDKLNIPNVGSPPPGASTITERLMAEQQMGLGMMVSSAGRKSSGQELPQRKSSGAVSESG